MADTSISNYRVCTKPGQLQVLAHRGSIKRFVELRDTFERHVIADQAHMAIGCLDTLEQELGHSLWLYQNRLTTAFLWHGLEGMRKLALSLSEQVGRNVTRFLMQYLMLRTESAQRKEAQRNILETTLKAAQISDELAQYFWIKLFGLHDISMRDAASLLLYDAQASLIDHYDALLAVMQSAVTNQAVSLNAIRGLEKPLITLYNAIGDRQLFGILRALGFSVEEQLSTERAGIIEAYTAGNYETAVDLSLPYLSTSLEDMGIFVLQIRACARINRQPAETSGVLKDVASNLWQLFKSGSAAYQSAFSLLTLADRFYAQSWIQYIRAVVLNELETEDLPFPSRTLRRVYVLDPLVSPFSKLASTNPVSSNIQAHDKLVQLYPLTCATYHAATTGVVDPVQRIDEWRMRKYLAKHALSDGDYPTALTQYEWLLSHTAAEDRLRSSAGAALTYSKLGMTEKAATTLVSAYLENRSLPSVLPTEAIAKSLDDAATWPNNIAVPLLFELTRSYSETKGLARLRYSFEKFLTDNHAEHPEDLIKLVAVYGRAAVIAFLDRVWRPEVMRQTLLYTSAREIEEARIQACKTLAVLDSAQASGYLEEVKERVKQLEIAKGTSLIDQSRVHVDIDAIKRALRRRLGDSYARYKGSSGSTGGPIHDVVMDIANVISRAPGADKRSVTDLFSRLHIFDTIALSESDVQFAAIFSEVTDEFLFGDHGLNAYLSTCVRHGTLSNTLRKSVSDEGIITTRQTNGTYLRNTQWTVAGTAALDALDVFSLEFDGIIDFIREELLQIRVADGREVPENRKRALFVYATSNFEIRYAQHSDKASSGMDELVTHCVNTLWDKTDSNLEKVQRVLEEDIRLKIAAAFDKLESAVRPAEWRGGAGGLINAIMRARTATQNRLTTVVSWFKRSEVYDRPDYAADFPAQIALNMIKSTISSAARWTAVTIERKGTEDLMPGRTLDALVYIFYDLFANALDRAGLAPDQLRMSAQITFDGRFFSALVTNSVAPSLCTRENRDRVKAHKESIFKTDTARRAQSEHNSGLHKLWNAIHSPAYEQPHLDFELQKSAFKVEFSFNISRSPHEHPVR